MAGLRAHSQINPDLGINWYNF